MSRILFDAFDVSGPAATPLPNRVRVVDNDVRVLFRESTDGTPWRSSMIKRRQGDRLPAIQAIAFSETGPIDLTQFTSIAFRMVSGTTIVTGIASGDAFGNLTYNLAAGDTAVPGNYYGYFVATDQAGELETFPSGDNLQIVVVPTV